MSRRYLVVSMLCLALVFMASAVRAQSYVFHGSMTGMQTLDRDAEGGNPFASALIETLGSPLQLSELPTVLRRLTQSKSKGFQRVDGPSAVDVQLKLVPKAEHERRIALVMVVSDYKSSGGAPSLPGARYDANRISKALIRAQFETEVAIDLGLRQMRERLHKFQEKAHHADLAVIYTTGHGVEVDGTVFLLPGDYPIPKRNSALMSHALPLLEIASAAKAGRVSLVFYGGCRDNPLR